MEMDAIQDLDFENWMGQLPPYLHSLPITALAIPGSHDSFSSTMTPNSDLAPDDASQTCCGLLARCSSCGPIKTIIYKWSLTQTLLCGAQLSAGIRYFDFRVAVKQPGSLSFYAVHGLYGDPVRDILEEMNRFLDSHPKEILLLDFSHFYNFTDRDHEDLVRTFDSVFGEKLLPFTTATERLSLSRLWLEGRQAVVVYRSDRPKSLRTVWPNRWMPSPWPATTDSSRMLGCLDEDLRKGRDLRFFHVSQGVLTPTAGYIFWRPCGSLRGNLSSTANAAIETWLQKQTLGANGVNVVMADFVESRGFVRNVVRINFSSPRDNLPVVAVFREHPS